MPEAMAKPRPREAPVMSATSPSSENIPPSPVIVRVPSKQKSDAPGGRNVFGEPPGKSAPWAPSTETYSLRP